MSVKNQITVGKLCHLRDGPLKMGLDFLKRGGGQSKVAVIPFSLRG